MLELIESELKKYAELCSGFSVLFDLLTTYGALQIFFLID